MSVFFHNSDSSLPSLDQSPCSSSSASLAHKLALCSSRDARSALTVEVAQKLRALPLRFSTHTGERFLHLLVDKSFNRDRYKQLEFQVGTPIKTHTVAPDVLESALLSAYFAEPLPLVRSIQNLGDRYTRKRSNQKRPELFSPPVQFLERLIDHALGLKASDIHIIPVSAGIWVSVRRFGQLLSHEETLGNQELARALVQRLCVLCDLDFTQTRAPLEGSFTHEIASQSIGVRVSMIPSRHGIKTALRLPVTSASLSLGNLGLSAKALQIVDELMRRRSGLLLFSGTTGSGKTTSSYAFLEAMAQRNCNVFSLEDPIERELLGVTQIEITNQEGLSFQSAFKALMRQDPDVIHIGEIRDQELARLSIEASLSGHLISGTIHAQSVEAAKRRLQVLAEMGNCSEFLSGFVIHQRLETDTMLGQVQLFCEADSL